MAIQLNQAQIDYITQKTNERGAVFAPPNFGVDTTYAFLSTGVIGNNHLQISVTRNRDGMIFSASENVHPPLPQPGPDLDVIIDNILTSIERRMELKPA